MQKAGNLSQIFRFSQFNLRDYFFIASSMATATATVAPTIGLLPLEWQSVTAFPSAPQRTPTHPLAARTAFLLEHYLKGKRGKR